MTNVDNMAKVMGSPIFARWRQPHPNFPMANDTASASS